MKTNILFLAFLLSCSSVTYGQELLHVPKALKNYRAFFAKPNVKKKIYSPKLSAKVNGQICDEVAKIISLTFESQKLKVSAITQCLVDEGHLHETEQNAIASFYNALADGDVILVQKQIKALVDLPKKSEVGRLIENRLEGSVGSVVASSWDEAADVAVDVAEVAGTIVGAGVGAGLGAPLGPVGAAAGAAAGGMAGGAVGRAQGKFWKGVAKLFRKKDKGDGVMAAPNGADCHPPMLNI